ncbi:MAG TPA: hypothetical protein VFL83_04785 [Anaeromyxobacter sp.]|nr:hypothetical protein [Anaeromyxobacter sp.]
MKEPSSIVEACARRAARNPGGRSLAADAADAWCAVERARGGRARLGADRVRDPARRARRRRLLGGDGEERP